MSRISFFFVVFLIGVSTLGGQERERRRVVLSEAIWPVFDVEGQTKSVQIGLQGLGKMEPDSSARVELALALLNSMLDSERLKEVGGWLSQEPSLKQLCTAWAKLALAAARSQHSDVWKRAKEEAERLAPISSQREGRAGWLLLYEGALAVNPEDARRYLERVPNDDFESQSALKAIKIRRLGEGLDARVDELKMKEILAPPPTEASLNLMAYALRLVEVLRGLECENGRVAFAAVAEQAVKCALESAANPAPVLVSVLAEAVRRGEDLPMMDEWFEKATKYVAIVNVDEEKPSYLLEMARVAEKRGDPDGQNQFLRASEKSLMGLEPALQPEGRMRLGQTYVRQGELTRAWQTWRALLGVLEHNPNRDLWFQNCCKIALEIDRWKGDKANPKVSALAELEALVDSSN